MEPSPPYEVPGLVTAEQLAPRLGVTPERLVELAQLGYAPHVLIDGKWPPRFHAKTVAAWARANLWRSHEGAGFPTELTVVADHALIDTPPPELARVIGLKQCVEDRGRSCVYFLVAGAAVVYVGQTAQLSARLQKHREAGPPVHPRLFPAGARGRGPSRRGGIHHRAHAAAQQVRVARRRHRHLWLRP